MTPISRVDAAAEAPGPEARSAGSTDLMSEIALLKQKSLQLSKDKRLATKQLKVNEKGKGHAAQV